MASKFQVRKFLANYAREQTDDGKLVIDLMVKILNGTAPGLAKNATRLKMEAGMWLIDRGYGKAPQEVSIETTDGEKEQELQEFSVEQLTGMIAAAENESNQSPTTN